MVGVSGGKALTGGHHRGKAALHVGGTASAQHAVADFRLERWGLPLSFGAGRDDISVTGKAQQRTAIAAYGPEIIDLAKAQCFAVKTGGAEAFHHQCLTAFVLWRDGAPFNQVDGKFEGRAHNQCSASVKTRILTEMGHRQGTVQNVTGMSGFVIVAAKVAG